MKCASSLGFLPVIAGRIFSRRDYLFLQNPRKWYQRINKTYYSENILNMVSEFWRNIQFSSSFTLQRFRANFRIS
jgi:hypothetical protein